MKIQNNMKKYLLFVMAVIMMASCNQPQTIKINVDLANADGKTIYLQNAFEFCFPIG